MPKKVFIQNNNTKTFSDIEKRVFCKLANSVVKYQRFIMQDQLVYDRVDKTLINPRIKNEGNCRIYGIDDLPALVCQEMTGEKSTNILGERTNFETNMLWANVDNKIKDEIPSPIARRGKVQSQSLVDYFWNLINQIDDNVISQGLVNKIKEHGIVSAVVLATEDKPGKPDIFKDHGFVTVKVLTSKEKIESYGSFDFIINSTKSYNRFINNL